MTTRYHIIVKNRSGAQQAIVSNFEYLAYTREVNAPGLLEFRLRGDHDAIATLELDGQIEVWRSDPDHGIDWYVDFYGLFRREQRQASGNRKLYTAYCVGQMDYLRRSIVAYPAATANRSTFSNQPAETIMKSLVTYNATNAGTVADGRDHDVGAWGDYIYIDTDSGGGSVLSKACARRNLLTVLQELAEPGGLDFDLVKIGAEAWEFRTYAGQRGTDRTSQVVFSLAYGNMDNVQVERYSLDEATVAIVGGQGIEDSREVVVRTGANYNSRYNSREVFVPAQQNSATAGLEAAGDARLAEVRALDRFDFETRDTEAVRYGRDWFLGDLVTARYEDIEQAKKIQAITVTLTPGSEQVERIRPKLVTA